MNATKPDLRHRCVRRRNTGHPRELRRLPLQHLPLRVDVRVHLLLRHPHCRHKLLQRGAEATDQSRIFVREVDSVVVISSSSMVVAGSVDSIDSIVVFRFFDFLGCFVFLRFRRRSGRVFLATAAVGLCGWWEGFSSPLMEGLGGFGFGDL
ncbi:fructokinase-like 1 [Actinidia rufa]|uniref:Fructokinase-like 1 n=1 Tax=Actinidia rufa TaxID=165716 RepID=A0A7J0E715_9ERIC|nr:fructokinase-like 1 [Actinidia rufa]